MRGHVHFCLHVPQELSLVLGNQLVSPMSQSSRQLLLDFGSSAALVAASLEDMTAALQFHADQHSAVREREAASI